MGYLNIFLMVVLMLIIAPTIDRPKIAEEQVALNDLECMASVVYYEARGEPKTGQIAVGQVVLNRVHSKYYPNDICAVAFQPYQFTDLRSIKYDASSLDIALKVIKREYSVVARNVTHYHATYVDPRWNKWNKLQYAGTIGNHVFYRSLI